MAGQKIDKPTEDYTEKIIIIICRNGKKQNVFPICVRLHNRPTAAAFKNPNRRMPRARNTRQNHTVYTNILSVNAVCTSHAQPPLFCHTIHRLCDRRIEAAAAFPMTSNSLTSWPIVEVPTTAYTVRPVSTAYRSSPHHGPHRWPGRSSATVADE